MASILSKLTACSVDFSPHELLRLPRVDAFEKQHRTSASAPTSQVSTLDSFLDRTKGVAHGWRGNTTDKKSKWILPAGARGNLSVVLPCHPWVIVLFWIYDAGKKSGGKKMKTWESAFPDSNGYFFNDSLAS